MTNTQHTPGPWIWMVNDEPVNPETYEAPGNYDNKELFGADKNPVVSCGEYDVVLNPADARLMAAAPELLAALRDLTDQVEQLCAALPDGATDISTDAARAAIAKATEKE